MPTYLRTSFFYFACLIVVAVFAGLIYSLLTFKRKDYDKETKEPNIKVEFLWTIIPFVMIVLMVLPIIKAYYNQSPISKSVKVLHKK